MEQGEMRPKGPLSENDKRRLVLKLVAQLRCVECGRLYDSREFTLVHRWEDMWVLSTRCQNCNEPCHVVVFMRLDAEPEPVTDLTPGELEREEELPPITRDDVLDVHVLLHEFEGELDDLWDL
jgi:hypothetical protein